MLINWVKALIEAKEKGIVSIKQGSRLAIKVVKTFSAKEVARLAVKKHAALDQFFCGSDEYYCAIQTKVLCNLFSE